MAMGFQEVHSHPILTCSLSRRVTNQEVGDGQTQATSIRVVTVSGSLQAVLDGVSSVLQQVMSHPRAAQLVELPFPFVPRLQAYAGAPSSLAW